MLNDLIAEYKRNPDHLKNPLSVYAQLAEVEQSLNPPRKGEQTRVELNRLKSAKEKI